MLEFRELQQFQIVKTNISEADYKILLSVTGDNSIRTASSPSFSGETTRNLVLLSPAGDSRKNLNVFQTP